MTVQQQAAIQSMTEWLSHENELGRKPHKIEVAGQFERHDMQYYIIKYKKNMLGGWLLGVCGGYEAPEDTEHCGHIFSEMQPYDQVTAEDEAIRMVEMVREYWMQQAAAYEAGQGAAHEEEGSEDGNGSGGVFNGFVLLNSSEFDIEQLKSHLQQDWNITVSDAEKEEDQAESDSDGPPPLVFEAEGCMLAVSFINAPVPDDEAVRNAASNYLWPQAAQVAETHVAQLIVAVFKREASQLDAAAVYTKLVSSCLKLPNAIGIYTSGTVFQPEFYQEVTENMKQEGQFPLLNLIYFGLLRTENGVSGYTIGLQNFGKDEIEVLDSSYEPADLRDFLADIAWYIISADVTLHDGETIGFSEEQKLAITRSAGVSLPHDTLKIQL